MQLNLMLNLHILTCIISLSKTMISYGMTYIALGVFFIVCWAIFHQYLAYNVRSMQPDLDVILVVQRQVCEDVQH